MKHKELRIESDIKKIVQSVYPNTITLQDLVKKVQEARSLRGQKAGGNYGTIANNIKTLIESGILLRLDNALYQFIPASAPAPALPSPSSTIPAPSLNLPTPTFIPPPLPPLPSLALLAQINGESPQLAGILPVLCRENTAPDLHGLKVEWKSDLSPAISPAEYDACPWPILGNKKQITIPYTNGEVVCCASRNGTLEAYYNGSFKFRDYHTITTWEQWQTFCTLIQNSFYSAFPRLGPDSLYKFRWVQISLGRDRIVTGSEIPKFNLKFHVLNDLVFEFYSKEQSHGTLVRQSVQKPINVEIPRTQEEFTQLGNAMLEETKKYANNQKAEQYSQDLKETNAELRKVENTVISISNNNNQALQKSLDAQDKITEKFVRQNQTANMKLYKDLTDGMANLHTELKKEKQSLLDQLNGLEKRVSVNLEFTNTQSQQEITQIVARIEQIEEKTTEFEKLEQTNQAIKKEDQIIHKDNQMIFEKQSDLINEVHQSTLDLYTKEAMERSNETKQVLNAIDLLTKNITLLTQKQLNQEENQKQLAQKLFSLEEVQKNPKWKFWARKKA